MGLGKVFINSITRELGRNVGKGVSNDLFGDWHSTPVRLAGKQALKKGFDLNFVQREEYDISSQPEYRYDSLVSCFFLYGVLGTILLLPMIFIWFKAIELLIKKETNLYAKIPMRKKDGRTKTGFRDVGTTYVKLESKRLLTDEEITNARKCAGLMILGQLIVIGTLYFIK